MKKCFWVMVLCVPALAGRGQQKSVPRQQFTIKGQLGAVKQPAKVYVIFKEQGFRKDSAEVRDNAFTLTSSCDVPQKAFLFLAQNGENVNSRPAMDQVALYLETGTVEVNSPDSLKHAKVGGTPLNVDQQGYIDAVGNLRELQVGISKAYREEKNKEKQEALMADYSQMDVLLQNSLAAFIQSHPNSQVALNALRTNFNPSDNIDLASTLYNSLSDSIKSVASAIAYKDAIESTYKLAVGKVAPDFTARDLAGGEKHLSDFKGKYVLLDFWASWCGPCRRESPNLVQSYAKYKSKGFEILSFSVDQSAEEWEKAVTTDKYTWTNVKEIGGASEPVAKLYSISAIPTNYLLGPDGKIIAMNLRGKELDNKLSEVIK